MFALDIRTIVVIGFICYVICALLVVQLWRQNRGQFAGIGLWALNFSLQAAGFGLIALRGAIPDWASIFLANELTFAGAIGVYVGLERFFDRRGPQLHNYLIFAACTLAFGFYALAAPDLQMRILIAAVFLLAICAQCFWLLSRRVAPALRPLAFGVSLVFAAYCALNVLRIGWFFVDAPTAGDYLSSGGGQVLVLICYLTLAMMLTFNLSLMVNQRLILDISSQREKFAKAFDAAPYAITLTRLGDGRIIDVNRGFESMTGYGRAEVLGKTTADLCLWQRAEDRAAVTADLARDGEVAGLEFSWRKKSGETFMGLLSAQILAIDGEAAILGCIVDITEHKADEAALREQAQSLRERNLELDRFNRLAVGRELDMIRLKQQVNALAQELGQAAPYAFVPGDVPPATAAD